MKPLLIVIRGNSGSGKTTLANKLQKHYGYEKCLVLHQDVIRRNILHTNDHIGTPAVSLIELMVNFGLKNYSITILEGILKKDVYGEMLERLVSANLSLVYYLDIPFEKTIQQDRLKERPFGRDKLQSWWREKDYLSDNDTVLNNDQQDKWIRQIIKEIKH